MGCATSKALLTGVSPDNYNNKCEHELRDSPLRVSASPLTESCSSPLRASAGQLMVVEDILSEEKEALYSCAVGREDGSELGSKRKSFVELSSNMAGGNYTVTKVTIEEDVVAYQGAPTAIQQVHAATTAIQSNPATPGPLSAENTDSVALNRKIDSVAPNVPIFSEAGSSSSTALDSNVLESDSTSNCNPETATPSVRVTEDLTVLDKVAPSSSLAWSFSPPPSPPDDDVSSSTILPDSTSPPPSSPRVDHDTAPAIKHPLSQSVSNVSVGKSGTSDANKLAKVERSSYKSSSAVSPGKRQPFTGSVKLFSSTMPSTSVDNVRMMASSKSLTSSRESLRAAITLYSSSPASRRRVHELKKMDTNLLERKNAAVPKETKKHDRPAYGGQFGDDDGKGGSKGAGGEGENGGSVVGDSGGEDVMGGGDGSVVGDSGEGASGSSGGGVAGNGEGVVSSSDGASMTHVTDPLPFPSS